MKTQSQKPNGPNDGAVLLSAWIVTGVTASEEGGTCAALIRESNHEDAETGEIPILPRDAGWWAQRVGRKVYLKIQFSDGRLT